MSQLLIHEHPLMVLPNLATAIGLNEAIILQQVHYWLVKSAHIRDGQTWIYNSYPEWQAQFPFWGLNTIKRAIYKLEEKGLLVTGNYNTLKIDRTKWYRIDYDKLAEIEDALTPSTQDDTPIDPKWVDQNINMGRPIPETNNRDYCNEVKQPTQYRKRLQSKTSKEGEIVVSQEFHAKAQYVVAKLGTPDAMKSSVLKMCKQYPDLIDEAVSYAADATVTDKTKLFFKRMHSVKDMA